MFTYYHIEIFIHHACSPTRFARDTAPAYEDAANYLIREGLLEYDADLILRSTEKGDAWGAMLQSTPLPVQRFIDPRFDSLEQ